MSNILSMFTKNNSSDRGSILYGSRSVSSIFVHDHALLCVRYLYVEVSRVGEEVEWVTLLLFHFLQPNPTQLLLWCGLDDNTAAWARFAVTIDDTRYHTKATTGYTLLMALANFPEGDLHIRRFLRLTVKTYFALHLNETRCVRAGLFLQFYSTRGKHNLSHSRNASCQRERTLEPRNPTVLLRIANNADPSHHRHQTGTHDAARHERICPNNQHRHYSGHWG